MSDTSKQVVGPWELFFHGASQQFYIDAGPVQINFKRTSDAGAEQMPAIARLIAAAQTMYEYIASSASNGCAEAAKIVEAINAGR